jgi:hypothetical protein
MGERMRLVEWVEHLDEAAVQVADASLREAGRLQPPTVFDRLFWPHFGTLGQPFLAPPAGPAAGAAKTLLPGSSAVLAALEPTTCGAETA